MLWRLGLIFIILIAFCSCIQRGNSVRVTVEHFKLGAGGYTGGLVIVGKSIDQQFTASIESGNSITIQLKHGIWNFRVVGWDGATPFSGTAHCGVGSAKLDLATATLEITTTPTNCTNGAFTSTGYTASTGTGLKPLKIFNCGTLVDTNLNPITTATSPSDFEAPFCDDNSSLPPSQKATAQSLRFYILGFTKLQGNYEGVSSGCLPTYGDELTIGSFPLNNIPFAVELFDSNNCTGTSIRKPFPNGLLGLDKAASVVNTLPGSYNALFLPFNSTTAPAQITSFLVKNSSNVVKPNNSIMNIGDVLTLEVTAMDPGGLPLEYKFLKGIGSSTSLIQDWSTSSSATYTIPVTDNGLGGLKIWVAIRNSDGVNYNSTLFGDDTVNWNYQISSTILPATLSSIVVKNSSLVVLASNSVLAESDTITIKGNGSDPNGLPIEYKFLSGIGSSTTIIQDWSSSDTATFTVSNSVLGLGGLKIWVAIRNNDGINFNSTLFGDGTLNWNYQAPGPYAPVQLISFIVKDLSLNVIPSGTLLSTGQQVILEINATDPNGLPIEYKFLKGINSSTTIIQDWSSSNTATYTIPAGDAGLGGLKIWAAVRNSDGRNFNSTLFGDAATNWSYQAN